MSGPSPNSIVWEIMIPAVHLTTWLQTAAKYKNDDLSFPTLQKNLKFTTENLQKVGRRVQKR